VISCIHLEEQTNDVLKLKSVSIYNHQGRSEASDVWGGDVGGFYVKFDFQSNVKNFLKSNNYNKAFCD
jgi:hypothetical protein